MPKKSLMQQECNNCSLSIEFIYSSLRKLEIMVEDRDNGDISRHKHVSGCYSNKLRGVVTFYLTEIEQQQYNRVVLFQSE